MKTPTAPVTLAIGDARVELLIDATSALQGIGGVAIAGVAMRGASRPIAIRIDSPDGFLYTRLEVADIAQSNGGATVRLRALGLPWGRPEYLDDYQQSTVSLALPTQPVIDEVTLTFAPSRLDLGGRAWSGFSYAIAFRSDTRKIHRIWTHATWEIGGSVTGNTVLSQGQCNMPVYRGSRDGLFTTACLRTLDAYGKPQGNSFQLGPRAGLIQGYDFQYTDAGALFQYWPDFTSIASLTESPPGSDLLHVVDEHRFTLANAVTTSTKHVLFTSAAGKPIAEHETRDLWWHARELVYGSQRKKYGVAPTYPTNEGMLRYGSVVRDGRLKMIICGEEVDSTEVPYAIGDRAIPRMAAAGFKRFFPEPFSQNDVSEVGLKRKLDDGIHGDLHCSSVCATHRFFPAEFWGGIKAWRYMYEKARAHGVELGAWFAPHFSPRARIYREHPEYMMISADGMPAGGGYGISTIIVADWNTGIYQWVLDDMKRWHDEGGLDYLFIDSLSNMGLLQANYSAAMRTNYDALARLWADFQRIGITTLSFECVAPPFGYGRFGLADLRGDLLGQDKSVAGQNDFGWWVGHEDMAVDLAMMVSPRKRSDEELQRILFRLMANRGFATFDAMIPHDYAVAPWYTRWMNIYEKALPGMTGQRRVLPDGAGTAWLDASGEPQVVWTFKATSFDARGAKRVVRLDEDQASSGIGGKAALAERAVYRLER